ncbi:pseudouridine-5'-phosphate glycosidase [Halarsenatibacter silvermanii]|uniref:Pseudouridine-5'-phosphate glycosidase (PseudoU degradation) n=1 Tax=Halarsenatibacter silvermanii TaxID=321763 RepID=A0A1G9I1Y1_9FIRM|nr:pseudouridine-5'-phosphate glycosidase [Halarsenatibacter silvermanii]SDL19219.1 Pseudouridine-5'-phosphate glycosidase (pseudoU degradation) [Halarsenatibacter silvermanii]
MTAIKVSEQLERKIYKTGRPVVTLETASLIHGLPHPENLEFFLRLQKIIEEEGALAAGVGVYEGEPKVGLTDEELKVLASKEKTARVDRCNLASAAAKSRSGGAAADAAIFMAESAGFNFLLTGENGLKGDTFAGDHESFPAAVLQELARRPLLTIFSGVQPSSDADQIYVRLKSRGVEVVGFRTDDPSEGENSEGNEALPNSVNSVQEAAEIFRTQRQLDMQTGMLLISDFAKKTGKGKSWPGKNGSGEYPEAEMLLLEKNARLGAALALAYRRLQVYGD